MFTNKDIFKLIAPILIESLLAIAIGMVDNIMVASAGEAAVSAVGLVHTINVLVLNFVSALAGGCTILVAQAIGKKETDSVEEIGKQTLYLCTFIGLVVTILCLIFTGPILNLMFGKVDADVMQQAQDYFFYTMITTPTVAMYSAISCYCRGQGETKRPMYIGIISNLINVIGNAILIYGFNMAAKGAAIATSASRIISTTAILIFALRSKSLKIRIEKLFRYKPNKYYISNICKIGIPNGVENSMFEIGRVMLSSLVSGMGTISIAANTVAQSLVSFQYTQGTAMGAGLITVVGTCIGADEKEQAQKYTKKILKFEYFSMIIVSLILCVFSSFFIGLFNLSPESALISKKLLYIHSIMACLIWPIAFVLPNAFRAATDIKFITIVTMVAMWAFRVALSYVFAYLCGFGIYSIWFAMFADWLFRICFFIPRFTSRRWLKKYNG